MPNLSPSEYRDLVEPIISAARQAGAAIMKIYHDGPSVRLKEDRSPVTDADQAAEELILAALSRIAPGIPVIAEEQAASGNLPEIDGMFFLVDPLDGTKEFLKQNGEFTVNIALIKETSPVFGLVYAPDKADCYVTLAPGQAARCALAPSESPARFADLQFEPLAGDRKVDTPRTAITSRSHLKPPTQAFLDATPHGRRIVMGSSLKFAVIARGDADFYPRFGPTSEWDTAAGHALLNATGGCVLTPTGDLLRYGKSGARFINPFFIAWRKGEAPGAAQGNSDG